MTKQANDNTAGLRIKANVLKRMTHASAASITNRTICIMLSSMMGKVRFALVKDTSSSAFLESKQNGSSNSIQYYVPPSITVTGTLLTSACALLRCFPILYCIWLKKKMKKERTT
jgi:hypothetical protein